MEWLMRQAVAQNDLSSPAGKASYIEELLPTLAKVDSAVERAAWLRRFAERAGIDEASARAEMRRFLTGRPQPRHLVVEDEPKPTPGPRPLLPAEKCLISLLLRGSEGVDAALGELSDADIAGLGSASILRAAKGIYLRGEAVNAGALQTALGEDAAAKTLTAIAVDGVQAEGVSPMDCVKELLRQPLKARMAEIQRKLKEASGEAIDGLLQEKNQLATRMASL